MKMMKLALLATVAVGAAFGSAASARMLDPAVPADAFEISKRMQCGEADGKPAVYHFAGKIYSRVEGEPDRLLFLAEGMNVRQCVAVEDPKRGKGYRLVSREVLFYLDPKTGQVLRQWANPWSGETVDVMHIHNDPVNSRPNFPVSADGKPATFTGRREGKWLLMPLEAPLFYENPLAGAYQDFIGGKYHAMEIFDFVADANDMLDTKNATSYPSVSWVRISDWMPWMKQRGRQGQMVFNAVGSKLHSYDELPAVMKEEIAKNYPIWTAPPPGDDPRPNATTWTVFKAQVDAARAGGDAQMMRAALLATAAVCALAQPAVARSLDPSKPEDALEINKRVACGTADGVPAVYYFSGQVWSRVDGEPDRHLFDTEAMNIRQCVTVTDPKRGKGYRSVSREVLFYLDPTTHQILREWKNPWTSETVEVMQVNNDPVNGRPSFPVTADGKPYTVKLQQVGPYSMTSGLAPLFYTNPLAGDYQDYIGGNYHAMEMLTSTMLTSELLDTSKPTVYPAIAWARVSVWLPWMKMRGRQGQLVFQSSGAKLKTRDELPAVVRDEIAANYPIYVTPPPGDDARPNVTTWSAFKKWIDGKRAAAKPAN